MKINSELLGAPHPVAGDRVTALQQPAGPEHLPTIYRDLTHVYQGYSAPAELVWSQAADLAQQAVESWRWKKLPLGVAIESGYTQAHLRRLIAEGKITNVGSPGEPAIYRCHLPRKPGFGTAERPPLEAEVASIPPNGTYSKTQVARAVASGD